MRGAHRDHDRGPQRTPPGPERAALKVSFRDYVAHAQGRLLIDVPRLDLEGPGIVLVLGSTGSGKSSLLRAATGIAPSLVGASATGAVEVRTRGVGYVPQEALDGFLSFDAEHEFVLRLRAAGRPLKAAREEAKELLVRLGLGPRARVAVHRLSAGERRRLLLAAIMVHEPDLLLLDEPFNHVDAEWRERLMSDIGEAARTRLVMVATHEPRPWLGRGLRALVIREGRLVQDGTLDDLEPGSFPELRLAPTTSPVLPSTRMEPAAIAVDGLVHAIGSTAVLTDVSLRFGPGVHALTGPNGAGKTTLLRILAGLARPERGTVRVDNEDPTRSATLVRHVALQFEEPSAAFFARTSREEIAFAPHNQGLTACDVEARLRETVADFALEPWMERHPYTLSGGEKERLALACLQAAEAPVVLMDEPTQGLDAPGRDLLVAFLRRIGSQRCILIATHDPEIISLAHTVTRLEEGRVVTSPKEGLPCIPS